MKLKKSETKRLALYFFYDKYGIIDDYVIYFLKSLNKVCKDILFISNGKLEINSRKKLLQSIPLKIIERDNKGFDVWAYKRGFEEIGFDNIQKYDEVVMTNFTIMGPVYPFEEMFDEMNKRDLDFWGITRHNGSEINPYADDPEKEEKMPPHIQSHFIAVRKNMLSDKRHTQYWHGMPMINKYEEAVNKHEIRFTSYFSGLGYNYDTFVDGDMYRETSVYPLMFMPVELIKKGCPIFKRKTFFLDMPSMLSETSNQVAKELCDYLDKQTDYNADLIFQNILRTANIYDIVNALNLRYVIDSQKSETKTYDNCLLAINLKKQNNTNLLEEKLRDLESKIDILIMVEDEGMLDKISKRLKKCRVEIKEKTWQPLLLLKNKTAGYDYVCFIDMVDHEFIDSGIVNETFNRNTMLSLIENEKYIDNVIKKFEQNKRLGLLIPPLNLHSMYFINIGIEWQNTYREVETHLKENNINLPIDKKTPPVSIPSNSFWFKTKALNEYINKTEDKALNKSKKKVNFNNYLKPFNNLYPYIVQNKGYYTAYIMSKNISTEQISHLNYYLSQNNKYLKNKASNLLEFKSHVYLKKEGRYRELNKLAYKNMYIRNKDNEIKIELKFPEDCDEFRFDLVELAGCLCKPMKIYEDLNPMDSIKIDIVGGIKLKEYDLFFNPDPHYIIHGNFKKDNVYTIEIPYYAFIMSEKDTLENLENKLYPILSKMLEEDMILKGKRGIKEKLKLLLRYLFNKTV